MSTTTKERATEIVLPEALVLVQHLTERDIYKDPETGAEGKPKYAVVLGFRVADVTGEGTVEDTLANILEEAYGPTVADEFLQAPRPANRISPFKDGTVIANEAKALDKDREACRGLMILSATSIYNKDGEAGPGGFKVYTPAATPFVLGGSEKLYSGMRGIAAVTFKPYKDYPRKGDRALTCYLTAFQKTADGTPLSSSGDKSNLFKPVGGAIAAPEGGRRRRAG